MHWFRQDRKGQECANKNGAENHAIFQINRYKKNN